MKTSRETGSKKRKTPVEGGAEKRQRVSLACEYCRSRKQRCDSGRPSCSACVAAGQSCVYDEKIRRRGLVPGYVRVLERLYGSLFARVHNSEDAIANLLAEHAIWPADNPEDDTNALFQRWKKSKVCQMIENKLNDNEVLVDNTTPATSRFEQDMEKLAAHTPDINTTRDRGYSQSYRASESTSTAPVTSDLNQDLPRPTAQTATFRDAGHSQHQDVLVNATEALAACTGWQRASAIAASSISLVLPSNSWRLFDIFFTFTTCWLPIVERRHIFKIAESYQGESVLLRTSTDRSRHSLLWAVLAYASYQDERSKEGSGTSKTEEAARNKPQELLDVAKSLTSDVDDIVTIEQAQALILLSLVSCGRADYRHAWQQLGRAASAIQCQPSPTSPSHKAIWSCCYVVDALVSAKCGLRPHLAGENAHHVDVDGVEEYERWSNRTDIQGEADVQIPRTLPQRLYSTFNTLLDLLHILDHPLGHYDTSRWLSDWYTNFCTSNRQALSSSGIFSNPGLAHIMMVYHFLHYHLDTTGNTHMAELHNIAALWEDIFGQATLPPTFTLFLGEEHAASSMSIWACRSGERGDALESANAPIVRRQSLLNSANQPSMVDNGFMTMPMPNTIHVPISSIQKDKPQQEPSNFSSDGSGFLNHHHSHRSLDTAYNVPVPSETLSLHLPGPDLAQSRMSFVGQALQSQQQTQDFRMFDIGSADGVDLDEWMYELAPRPELSDHSAFMMNLGAIGGHNSFDNMFTYTDLS